MTPSARLQAAIDLLDATAAAACEGGAAADTLIARYFRDRRYAGSKDRRAVRDLVYAAIRLCAERPESGRAAMLALARERSGILELFDGSTHGPAPVEPGEPVARTGLVPGWLLPHLAEPLRDEGEQCALLERAPLDLRINRLKPANDVRAAFPDAQPVPGIADALRVAEGTPVEQSDVYRSGLIEIQDAGSQAIVMACAAKPGMTVVDLCAGAGGKTLGLAAAMMGKGRLLAADVNRERLSRLPERASRAGADNVEPLLLDARREAQALAPFAASADVVLVDAPCSGSGTWRRNPEARWRLTEARLAGLVLEQARILDFAAALVKPGGRLAYAVCALTDVEGQDQVRRFLNGRSGWAAVDPGISLGRKYGEGLLLTPAHDGTDGFFIAALQKS